MNEIGKKFLPLGTVVMLKGATKRLMITGFCTMAAENTNGELYDYSGCIYPEGIVSSDQTALFNHDQITKIYYMGLVDQEEEDFKKRLNEFLNSNSFDNVVNHDQNHSELEIFDLSNKKTMETINEVSNEFEIPKLPSLEDKSLETLESEADDVFSEIKFEN